MSTILIIEDEPFFRQIVTLELQDAGYTVRSAEDGKRGLESIAEQVPDLVLLDLRMPAMNGYEVLQELQIQGFSKPIIVLSNEDNPKEKEKCRNLGSCDFVCKSNIDPETLIITIQKYIP